DPRDSEASRASPAPPPVVRSGPGAGIPPKVTARHPGGRAEGLSVGAIGYALFVVAFLSIIGLALLISEQARRDRGLDDTNPNATRGGFGRGRRPITRGELALGLLAIGATLALLALGLWR